jgi:dephospho-CoA kinase
VSRLVIGLTGGIGSGKSTVAGLFVAHGAALVDTDAIAHALTAAGGAAMPALRAAFGDDIARDDGALDRARMRERVFADPVLRKRLEQVLHPMIRELSHRQVDAALAAGAPYVVLAVPLLVESGDWASRCDRVLLVDCPVELQRQRVMARSRLSAQQIDRILAAQATREARRAVAHDVIDNDRDAAALADAVATLHARYSALARAEKPD